MEIATRGIIFSGQCGTCATSLPTFYSPLRRLRHERGNYQQGTSPRRDCQSPLRNTSLTPFLLLTMNGGQRRNGCSARGYFNTHAQQPFPGLLGAESDLSCSRYTTLMRYIRSDATKLFFFCVQDRREAGGGTHLLVALVIF